ncbi:MAG: efflux RND transporter periplasmic adaptor subunit [Nitrosomonadales bacterium]|nr:efflux RND transporter periplasmic adaptor subunit [Nitrosomonadales bacterium]
MKPISKIIIGALVVLGISAAGYWFDTRMATQVPTEAASAVAARKEPKILYYRNPMGLPDTSPAPKKDNMGMDYLPVYEGGDEPGSTNQLKISVEKVQKLGVRTEQAAMRVLDKTVRAVGRVEANERHIYNIAPKFEGWIEKLYVNTTGEPVKKGQALLDVYSPELVSAQREYAIAAQGVESLKEADGDTRRSMQQLAESSLLRLKNWDISAQQVQGLAKSETAKRDLTFHAPVNGIVLEKKALQGMRFMPGEMLYQIADLSSVWVIADVFEQDIALVSTGVKARVKINAYPDKVFEGFITYVYPTLNPATRTVPVRLEIANPDGLLKPAMFAQVEIPVPGKGKVLAVPVSAVIDSGTRQIVLVQLAEGRFEPREVRLGSRSDNYVEVLDGIAEGEQVVVAANFLIDAESNLKAALGGLGHAHGGGTPQGDAKGAMEQAKPAVVGHQAEGKLDGVDSKAGRVTITHGPIKTLDWPGMTMDFALANPSLATGIQPGSAISFELVERKPGEWVITKLQAKPAAPSGNPHAGH